MDDGLFLTVDQAAERLGLNPETIRRRIRRGTIKAQLIDGPRGEQYSIPASELVTQEAQIAPVPQLPQPVLDQLTNALVNGLEPIIAAERDEHKRELAEQEARHRQEMEALKAQFTDLKKGQQTLSEQSFAVYKQTLELTQETRAERERQRRQRWWRFWD